MSEPIRRVISFALDASSMLHYLRLEPQQQLQLPAFYEVSHSGTLLKIPI